MCVNVLVTSSSRLGREGTREFIGDGDEENVTRLDEE